jgi:hypothetical protein
MSELPDYTTRVGLTASLVAFGSALISALEKIWICTKLSFKTTFCVKNHFLLEEQRLNKNVFLESVVETKIFLSAPAPAPDSFIRVP